MTSLATIPALAKTMGIVSLLRLTVCLSLAFACLLHFPFLAFLTLVCPSLALCPSAPTCLESCAAKDQRRFCVPVSTIARTHARLGRSRDFPREPLSRDHGKLLASVASQ